MLSLHRKLQTQIFFYLLFCVFCLAACAPMPTNVIYPSKTATHEAVTATITPKPTHTPKNTQTSLPPLPMVAIPEMPTPGAGLITVQNLEKIEVLDIFGNGKAYSTRWSPNGNLLGIETSLGWKIYDTATWQQVKSFGDTHGIGLDWSPNGKLLAIQIQDTAEDQPVYIYDGETFELMKVLRKGNFFYWFSTGEILAISDSSSLYLYDTHLFQLKAVIQTTSRQVSPDGKTIAALDKGRVLRLWDTTTGKLLSIFENFMDDNGQVYHFEYSSNGKKLLILNLIDDFNFEVFILDLITGKISYTIKERLEFNRTVRAFFRPDGLEMVLQIYKTVRIIDVSSGSVRKKIEIPYEDYVDKQGLDYSPDGKQLITTGGIFNIETGVWLNHTEFTEFVLSPQGRFVARFPRSPGSNGEVMLWDLQEAKYLSSVPASNTLLHPLSFSSDEKEIVTFDEFGNASIYDINTGVRLHTIAFNDTVYSMAFGPKTAFSTGYILAVAERTGPITVWDTGNHQVINTFLGRGGPLLEINPVAISPNGQLLAYRSRASDGGLQIADIFSGKVLQNLMVKSEINFKMLAFSPDGKTLVASGDGAIDGGLAVWNVDTGDTRGRLGFGDNFEFDFMPKTSQVVLAHRNFINFWDVNTGKFLARWKRENMRQYDGYASTAVSTDGRLLAAGTYTDLIDIWDMEKRQLLRSIQSNQGIPGYDGGDDATIKGITFSPHTHILATLGADGSVRVWDADTGFSLPFGATGALAFSPDGALWAAGRDGQVHLFALPTPHK